MLLKKSFYSIVFNSFLLLSYSTCHADSKPNLYIKFQENTLNQQIEVDTKNARGQITTIQCGVLKSKIKSKPNVPSCGFGFASSPVIISQIRYGISNQSLKPICQELTEKNFSHGTLFIFNQNNKITCNLKLNPDNHYSVL